MSIVDNRFFFNDCTDNTQVCGESTATPTDDVEDPGAVIQGATSIAFQVADAQEVLLFAEDTSGTAFSFDMTTKTIYENVKHNLGETFEDSGSGGLGGQIAFGDSADGAGGDIVGYNVNGNDVAGFPYLFRFTSIKLDVSVIVADPGVVDVNFSTYAGDQTTLDLATVQQIGYGSFNVEKAISTGKNAWMDGIYFIENQGVGGSPNGIALSITGGTAATPETTPGVAAADVAVGAGMVNNPKGTEFGFFAPTEWGDAAADSFYTGTDEQWYWIGDNAGGHNVAENHFPFRLIGDAGSTNSWVLNRVVIVNTGRRAQFDMSDPNMDFMQLTGCSLIGLGTITLPRNDADKFCNTTTFVNCDQIDLQSIDANILSFSGTNALGTTGSPFSLEVGSPLGPSDGAIVWDEIISDPQNQDNVTFIANAGSPRPRGHAIEIRPLGVLNGSPGVALGSPQIREYNIDGYTFDGYSTNDGTFGSPSFENLNAIWFINPEDDNIGVTINLSDSSATNPVGGGTDSFSFRRRVGYTGKVSINSTVTVTITVLDIAGNPIQNAQTAVFLAADGSQILNADTNASGVASGSFGGGVPADVSVRVRKNSPGDTRYFPVNTPQEITSTGLNLTVTLQEDEIAV